MVPRFALDRPRASPRRSRRMPRRRRRGLAGGRHGAAPGHEDGLRPVRHAHRPQGHRRAARHHVSGRTARCASARADPSRHRALGGGRGHAAGLAAWSGVANVRVRNTGTIGGNLAFAEPHRDPATFLLACGATVELAGAGGDARMGIGDFIVGPLLTAREPDEIILAIESRRARRGRGAPTTSSPSSSGPPHPWRWPQGGRRRGHRGDRRGGLDDGDAEVVPADAAPRSWERRPPPQAPPGARRGPRRGVRRSSTSSPTSTAPRTTSDTSPACCSDGRAQAATREALAVADTVEIEMTVNDTPRSLRIEPRETLAEVLRERLALTGTKVSCDAQVCGACTVLVDGLAVSACTYLAVDADGRGRSAPSRGSRPDGRAHARSSRRSSTAPRSSAGSARPGCSWPRPRCSRRTPIPAATTVIQGLEGNLCRCTGYAPIVEAVSGGRGRCAADRRDRAVRRVTTRIGTRRRPSARRCAGAMAWPR